MTNEQYRERLAEVEEWANTEVNRLVFDGVKPVSIADKVDVMVREAAHAMGNRTRYAREIIGIEQSLHHLSEVLDALWFQEKIPAPPTPRAALEAKKWMKKWGEGA